MGSRTRQSQGKTGTFLVLVGIFGVLGATFLLGVMAGRLWPGRPPVRAEAPAKTAREKAREKEARAAEEAPTLTFYRELTAPLTAPPPARAPRHRAEPPKPAALPEGGVDPSPGPSRFTVQVGAYKTREPAETLRGRLAAAGHAAYVSESPAAGGVRYRVRVGSFHTRGAAQEAAARIAADGTVPAFVTTR